MKIAIVHYWIVSSRGGERVLDSLCDLYPDADIFTLVLDPKGASAKVKTHKITTSYLQKIGGAHFYKLMLPLMPSALEQFDLSGYDLVISSESGPAKGVITGPETLHVCYCHSPMRYLWDLHSIYFQAAGPLGRLGMMMTGRGLRQWDLATSFRVDQFVANSNHVARRIRKYYHRSSQTIYPPVETSRFSLGVAEDFYLLAGQNVPYKKAELAVDAFRANGRRLVVAGDGYTREFRRAAPPNVTFLGQLADDEMARLFSTCRSLIFPGVEDFGIVPVEVMASGRPVIAYGAGGALETVVDGSTGHFFERQTPEALSTAIERFERTDHYLDPTKIRSHALKFDRTIFEREFAALISRALKLELGQGLELHEKTLEPAN